jgi:hypothetical protein
MGSRSITVGNMTVEPGTKKKAFWDISSKTGGQPVRVPVTVINGSGSGPTVWIQAGLHGDEYQSIAAAMDLAVSLHPEELSGQVVLVTVLNAPALENFTRESGVDGVNLNTAFPGSSTGTTSQILAAEVLDQVVSIADFAIDLHGGGVQLTLPPFTMYHDDEEGQGLRLAKAFGLEILLKTDGEDRWVDGMFYAQASRRGIPSILSEGGWGPKVTKEAVDIHLKGVRGVLAELGILHGETPVAVPRFVTTIIEEDSRSKTARGGFVRILTEPGVAVRKGDLIGTVHDYFGDKVEDILASTDGIVLDLLTRPVVGPGQLVALIGKRVTGSGT